MLPTCCADAKAALPLPWLGTLLRWGSVRAFLSACCAYANSPSIDVQSGIQRVLGDDWLVINQAGSGAVRPAWIYARNATQAVLAFGGTQNEQQLLGQIMTLNLPPVVVGSFSITKYHDDTAENWLGLAASLGLNVGDRQLTIAGHSYGGGVGVAVLNRLQLGNAGLPLAWLVMGMPRTLGVLGRNFLKLRPGYAIVNFGDYIPLLPPDLKRLQIFHAGLPGVSYLIWPLYSDPPRAEYVLLDGSVIEWLPDPVLLNPIIFEVSFWQVTGQVTIAGQHQIERYTKQLFQSRIYDGADVVLPWIKDEALRSFVEGVP